MDYPLFKEQLSRLVEINSVCSEPQTNAPFGEPVSLALKTFLDFAKSFGFESVNYDNYAGEVIFGSGEEIGVLCHLDIVPVGKLSDWNTPPFTLTEQNGKLIGRGVLDDKAPALLILHAMAELKNQGYRPQKKIRLILGCNEESGWGCINHLKRLGKLPETGFSPDADFPVIYAEKGIVHAEFEFECNNLQISGGNASNMVCDLVNAVCPINYDLAKKYGLTVCQNTLTALGKTAHASLPHKGVNAIEKILEYLEEVNCVSREIREKLFLNSTGIKNLFDQTGKLTLSPNKIYSNGNKLLVLCDIRYPATLSFEQVEKEIEKIGKYQIKSHQKSLFADKNGSLVKTLLSVYQTVSGDKAEPIAIGGGTYARSMKNCVAFGPAFREQDAVCHEPNEYIKVEDLLLAYKIYKRALIELTNDKI